jgi:AraC family transcriptional regulator
MFQKITEGNLQLLDRPPSTDMVYFSELKQWSGSNAFRSFCIKYVIEGRVHYLKGKKEYTVNSSQYLLACQYPGVAGIVDSSGFVKSICIDICPATIAEAYTVLTGKSDNLENYLAGYFDSPEFMESIHSVHSTSIGYKLQSLFYEIVQGDSRIINKEWFFNLSERMIYQEYGNYLALHEIHSVKPSTRQEILRRLQIAKDFMDDNFLSIESVTDVAQHCSMSAFYFYRRFKEVYKRTPYQYITENKMQYAKTLLKDGNNRVSDVATMAGYQDVFSFSKAFKKFYGVSPSEVVK